MCILFLHFDPSSNSPYLLVAANNRDELMKRPTAPADFWTDQPHILAGRDLFHGASGGTWLGITQNGRFAVLTNYRCRVSELQPDAKTRGHLVTDFLSGSDSPLDYCTAVLEHGDDYNGFSLITADLSGGGGAVYCSNRSSSGCQLLSGGVYGLSNELLDSPWRKVVDGKKMFSGIVSAQLSKEELTRQLLDLLANDDCLHPDPNIPDLGFSEPLLKTTSSIFVHPVGNYGTRTSTVLLVGRDGEVTFSERTMVEPIDPQSPQWTTSTFTFNIPQPVC